MSMPDPAKIDSTLRTLTLKIGAGDTSPETLEMAEKLTALKEQYLALHAQFAIGDIMERVEAGAPGPSNAALTAPHARTPHVATHHVARIRGHIKKRRREAKSDDEIREELSKLNDEAAGAGFNAKDHPLGKIAKAALACDDATVGRIFRDLDDESDTSADDEHAEPTGGAGDALLLTHQVGDTSVKAGVGWRRGKEQLDQDPRYVPPGPVWLKDARDDTVGGSCIDSTVSGLREPRQHRVLQEIGKRFFLGPKQPDIIPPQVDGTDIRLVVADLIIKPSSVKKMQVLNLIAALAQSGKAAEMEWGLWAFIFILGCAPYLQLRRAGGKADTDMVKKDFAKMNDKIGEFLDELRFNKDEQGQHGKGGWGNEFAWLDPGQYDRYMLDPKVVTDPGAGTLDVDVVHAPWTPHNSNEFVVRLSRPQVLIALMTPASMNKMYNEGLRASDRTWTAAMKKMSFYQLFGGWHNLTHRVDGVVKIIHSAYIAKCIDPCRPCNDSDNRKVYRVISGKDELDSVRGDERKNQANSLMINDKRLSLNADRILEEDAHQQTQLSQKKRAKAEGLKRTLRYKKSLFDLGDEMDAEDDGDEEMGGDEEAEFDGAAADEPLNGVTDPAGRLLRERPAGRKAYVDRGSSDEEGEEGDDGDDEEEGGGGGRMTSKPVPNEEERVALEELDQERRFAEMEAEEAERLDNEMRKTCSFITGEISSLFGVIATTATSSSLMHKHPGVPTTVRTTRMHVPDSYLQHEFMLAGDHPNRAAGYCVKTVQLASRPTGTIAGRTDLIERDCVERGVANADGSAPSPLKRSFNKFGTPSYRISNKMKEDFPEIAELSARVDLMTEALKRRPTTVWARNKDNLERVICEGLQQRRVEARDKGQQTPHGLVINNDTIQTSIKTGIMDNVLSRFDSAISGQLLCYSFTGDGLEVRFRGDQLPSGQDADELVKMINDPGAAMEQIKAHLGEDGLSEKTANELLEGVNDFLAGCKQKGNKPGRPAEGQKPDVHCEYTKVDLCQRDDDGVEVGKIPVVVIKSTCKQPGAFLTVAHMFNLLRAANGQDLPLPTLGFTNAVGERAVRYSDYSHSTRLIMQYQTNDVHIARLFTQNGASIIQAGCRICGLWKRPCNADGTFDDTNFMQPVYYSTDHFLPLFKNAMFSEREWSTLLEEYGRDDESPTDTATRVLKAQTEEYMGDATKTPEFPELLKWLESTVNHNPKSFFRHSMMGKAEMKLRVDEWKGMTERMREEAEVAPLSNPFTQRFSELHGVGGNEEARKQAIEAMKQQEAAELVQQERSGELQRNLEKWDQQRKAQKAEQQQRKAAKDKAAAERPLRASRKRNAPGEMEPTELEKLLGEFEQVAHAAIGAGQNTVEGETFSFPYSDEDAQDAMRDVRELYRKRYIKQLTDMGDNDQKDLSSWLDSKDSTQFKHFIKPQLSGKMTLAQVTTAIESKAKQLCKSLRLVYVLVAKDKISSGEATNRAVALRDARAVQTRTGAAKSTIRRVAARAVKRGRSQSNADSDDDDSDSVAWVPSSDEQD